MAQLSADCFAFDGKLLPVEAALRLIRANVQPVPETELAALAEADGRVLAGDVAAQLDLPGFANSAVDGYAVRGADLSVSGQTVLPVEGRVAAGQPPGAPLRPGSARRIFTGAMLPAGADTVFMQEDVALDEAGRVRLPPGLRPGSNTRRQGEDVLAGSHALPQGRRLRPQDLALAGALGLAALPVRRRLRVAIFSTGNEIASPWEKLGPGKLYDANRPMLAALARRAGAAVADLGILPDSGLAITAALAAAAETHDLLISSGGVSAGEEDHVRRAIEAEGRLVFWRLAIKPGRPVAMGVVRGAPVIGLPGNPAAAFVTFAYVVRPLLAALSGAAFELPLALPAALAFGYRKKAGRREYVRVRLSRDEAGRVWAHKHPQDGAGVITSLTETDGLAELLESVTTLEAGEAAGVLPYWLLL